ncbi:metallo-beta-lactamase superfamily protein [Fusarium flagelliforme]|uniref:Metallo-beta-lactamase superfamily protein n=1 Tax=Fusarium flagelliforme TaxID=2675880 RepID=A0A395MXK7_9HYPO|nr:metallo-beta-lactamase superfamily protein [Fusarium flagelliforme]
MMGFSNYLLFFVVGLSQAIPNASNPAKAILEQAINALGGASALGNIEDVTYRGAEIYRSRSTAESFALTGVDNSVSSVGVQNVTFSFHNGQLTQRIDRRHQMGPYWTWARPVLNPIDMSLVIRDGDDGYAAVVEGSYSLFAPGAPPSGPLDGLLAAYLINEATKMSPLLLNKVLLGDNYSLKQETFTSGARRTAIHDKSSNISIILDKDTALPHIVRSYENHPFWGPSTRDYVLQNYTTEEGVKFPRRFKTVYNDDRVVEDFSVADVLINTNPDVSYSTPRVPAIVPPTRDNEYDFAEIGELFTPHTWGGAYRGTLANLSAINPYPDLPGVWLLIFKDAETYRQMVYEFNDFVVVLDAPPHQSHLVIQWVTQTLKKPLKYVWPSHHHHDHAFGVRDYVAAGAKVIALDFAVDYYSTISDKSFATYPKMRVTFAHMKHSIHAEDYSYALAYPTRSSKNSTVVIFDADHSNPTTGLSPNDQTLLFGALGDYARHRVPLNSIYVSGHGDRTEFKKLPEAAGFLYPNYTLEDYKYWKRGPSGNH